MASGAQEFPAIGRSAFGLQHLIKVPNCLVLELGLWVGQKCVDEKFQWQPWSEIVRQTIFAFDSGFTRQMALSAYRQLQIIREMLGVNDRSVDTWVVWIERFSFGAFLPMEFAGSVAAFAADRKLHLAQWQLVAVDGIGYFFVLVDVAIEAFGRSGALGSGSQIKTGRDIPAAFGRKPANG